VWLLWGVVRSGRLWHPLGAPVRTGRAWTSSSSSARTARRCYGSRICRARWTPAADRHW